MVIVSESNLLKGGVVMALLWWAWFREPRDGTDRDTSREIILATIAGSLVAITLSRFLVASLPFRPRPLVDPALHFLHPYSVSEGGTWTKESAFPSDHATLFFELAAGLFLASPRLGTVGFCLVGVFICLPRIYLGLHSPTDILGGALLGIGIAWLASRRPVRGAVARVCLSWMRRQPGTFYAALFLVSYQIATLFADARALASFAVLVATNVLGGSAPR